MKMVMTHQIGILRIPPANAKWQSQRVLIKTRNSKKNLLKKCFKFKILMKNNVKSGKERKRLNLVWEEKRIFMIFFSFFKPMFSETGFSDVRASRHWPSTEHHLLQQKRTFVQFSELCNWNESGPLFIWFPWLVPFAPTVTVLNH